jgi:hypothetical protein
MTAPRSASPRAPLCRHAIVAFVVAAPACVQPAWGQTHPSNDAGARAVDAGDAGRTAPPPRLDFGDTIGGNFGYGGLGLRGTSRQTPDASVVGLGSLGTMGHGAGTGSGAGFGSGSGRMGRPVAGRVQVTIGSTSSRVEGLSAVAVRQVVLRSRAALAYCFARSPGPADAGVPSATLRFTVRPDGAVTPTGLTVSVTAAGPDVPACLRARVLTMMFPPTGDHRPVTVAQGLTATAP